MFVAFRSMRAPHDTLARDFGPGPTCPHPVRPGAGGAAGTKRPANDNEARALAGSIALPADALAIVEPVPVATNQGGRARRDRWRLRFAERTAPFVDRLTGWMGGCDPLTHVELRFPNLEAAERYCRAQHLRFEVRGPAAARPRIAPRIEPGPSLPICCWPTGPHAFCCGGYRSSADDEPAPFSITQQGKDD
jgi:hypothetical protein